VTVNVFHHDRGFINKNAHGQCQSAERHDVDGLPRTPEHHDGGKQREGNGGDHDEGAAPIAQEEQYHQSGEQGSQQALFYNRKQ